MNHRDGHCRWRLAAPSGLALVGGPPKFLVNTAYAATDDSGMEDDGRSRGVALNELVATSAPDAPRSDRRPGGIDVEPASTGISASRSWTRSRPKPVAAAA